MKITTFKLIIKKKKKKLLNPLHLPPKKQKQNGNINEVLKTTLQLVDIYETYKKLDPIKLWV